MKQKTRIGVVLVVASLSLTSGDAFAQAPDDLLAHREALRLWRPLWDGNSSAGVVTRLAASVSDLGWIASALAPYPFVYTLEDSLVTDSYVLFAAANRISEAKYIVIGLLRDRTLIGLEPDVRSARLVLFDLEADRSLEIDVFGRSTRLLNGAIQNRALGEASISAVPGQTADSLV